MSTIFERVAEEPRSVLNFDSMRLTGEGSRPQKTTPPLHTNRLWLGAIWPYAPVVNGLEHMARTSAPADTPQPRAVGLEVSFGLP